MKMDSFETEKQLLNSMADANREFHGLLGELERAERSGNRKLVLDVVLRLNKAEARCLRLVEALTRCREAIASRNPFIKVFKKIDRLNEPEMGKDLTGWIIWTDEVI